MKLKDRDVWKSRWESLWTTIEGVVKVIPDTELAQADTFRSLLECLKTFGKAQFNFFYEGFNGGAPRLETSRRFPPEFALRKTIDQIAYDLAVIQQALAQRNGPASTPEQRRALARADQLAYEALMPAICGGLLDNTVAITYFQKAPTVRVIPYAPVALIGIPLTCVDQEKNARDFLAIPHEVGHYVFWHGRVNGAYIHTALRNAISEEPIWRYRWLEEIFADVYGCLVAGPVIAHDFQEVIFDNLHLDEDDGVHPIGIIRPFLYTDTLQEITLRGRATNLFNEIPKDLNKVWESQLERRNGKDEFVPKRSTTKVKAVDARFAVKQVVSEALKLLQTARPEKVEDVWSRDTTAINELYTEFYSDKLTSPLNDNMPRLVIEEKEGKKMIQVTPYLPCREAANPRRLVGESRGLWFDVVGQAKDFNFVVPPEAWSVLVSRYGWAVGGPEDNPPVGP